MSVIIKFLIILVLCVYLFSKVAGFLVKMVLGNMRNNPGQFSKSNQHTRKAPDSNLNIDSMPRKSSKKDDYKGGEYVDYEEVK